MITHTFQILSSVGAKKEKAIWENGVRFWNEFLEAKLVDTTRPDVKERDDVLLTQASELLDDDFRSLAGMMPRGEVWRMYCHFRDSAAYLDIETNELSRDSLVTVVTVHRPGDTVTLTEGINLTSMTLSDALEDATILVMFNDSCFDVLVLRNSFPKVDLDIQQFDLWFTSRKVGYSGGLKPLEMELGITRDEDIEGVGGADAVRLWKMWERTSNRNALEILAEYNRADTINFEIIADIVYERLVREHAGYRW